MRHAHVRDETHYSREDRAYQQAQAHADAHHSPVGVWQSGRVHPWYAASDVAPELQEPDPESLGYRLIAVVTPRTQDEVPS